MKDLLEPGKYVVAVSGGIDSIVLLDMLRKQENLELITAHFDHGIRPDSAEDASFVSSVSYEYGLPFETKRVELGPGASEALARGHRYEFLDAARKKYSADAIVTAHHQDDLIETAVLNVLRGTKRRGLVSLRSTQTIKRPLLHMTKPEIKDYARTYGILWREDSTNNELIYKRNRVRKLLSQNLTAEKRKDIIEILNLIVQENNEIDALINDYLKPLADNTLRKGELNKMQLAEAYEITAAWLRRNGVGFEASTLSRIVIGARYLDNGSQIDVQSGWYCLLKKNEIVLTAR
jgi:tRNA(Ile)-lysidine synthetase-like protein